MKQSTVTAYVIINDRVEVKTFPLSDLIVKNDMYYHNDNYGMGAVHWSVINQPSDAYERQLKEDLIWAKERLLWAKENAPKEITHLTTIIDSNGYMRNPGVLIKLRNTYSPIDLLDDNKLLAKW